MGDGGWGDHRGGGEGEEARPGEHGGVSGINASALCDGAAPIFRNKPLALIGCGDSGAEEATCQSSFSSLSYIFVLMDLGGQI
jgi:thioredoxin reductase